MSNPSGPYSKIRTAQGTDQNAPFHHEPAAVRPQSIFVEPVLQGRIQGGGGGGLGG